MSGFWTTLALVILAGAIGNWMQQMLDTNRAIARKLYEKPDPRKQQEDALWAQGIMRRRNYISRPNRPSRNHQPHKFVHRYEPTKPKRTVADAVHAFVRRNRWKFTP